MKHLLILPFLFFSISFSFSESKIEGSRFITQKKQSKFKASQLIGIWYFLSKDNDTKTKTENLTDGKYINLKKSKKYNSDVFEKDESGKWHFNEKSQILILENKTTKTELKLNNVNKFGMVLINQVTNEKWYFALAE